MSSLTGDGAPKDLRDQADAEDESTRVDRSLDLLDEAIASHEQDEMDGMGPSQQTATVLDEATKELVRAIRLESRAAYLGDVPDKHHPDL